MKIIVLVGLPGSGKSTYRNQQTIPYVNQDELGNCDRCIEKATEYIKNGQDVIIDRTNIDKHQRKRWIKLARYLGAEVECVYFKSTPEKCFERMVTRKGHETIPEGTPKEKMKSIINKFAKSLEEPSFEEGFSSISVFHVDNLSSEVHKNS